MKTNYIVKNGNRETGEMSVFEAVEVLKNFKGLADEKDKIEIHSFCKHWAIKKAGKVSRFWIFQTKEEAEEIWWATKPENIEIAFEVVEVREFLLWFRKNDNKDFIEFYSDAPNLEDAVEEAINETSVAITAIEYEGEIVSRYGVNFIKCPEKRK